MSKSKNKHRDRNTLGSKKDMNPISVKSPTVSPQMTVP